ncbi:hypothetical protein OAK68_01105, partial [Akkermansiaceae bacterium]|nr:hypothetical protein [Akkermansiaceae bacterium]
MTASSVSGASRAVTGAGDDQHVEIAVGFDQGVYYLHGRGRVDVAVQLAHDQQQLSLKLMGVGHVGTFGVFRSHGPTHP